ncbi:MAG: metallophosphoesterase family protein [Pseudonocardia sp.]
MRCAVISDVHGNLHALRAVLASIAGEGVDRILCLGDLVGYGPHPNECVATIAEAGIPCVAGNHDLIALGVLSEDRCGPMARATNGWTRDALDEPSRTFLTGLARRTRVGDVVLAHGSLDDPQQYVSWPALADELLDRVRDEEPGTRVLALGHTHHAWAHARRSGTLLRGRATGRVPLDPGQPHLVNPGSVGQSRDRSVDARYVVVDLERDEAEFRAVAYDVAAHVAALVRAGLPARTHQLVPSRWRTAKRVARSGVRAARRLLLPR